MKSGDGWDRFEYSSNGRMFSIKAVILEILSNFALWSYVRYMSANEVRSTHHVVFSYLSVVLCS